MSLRICLDARKLWDSGIGTYLRGLLTGFAEVGGNLAWDFIVKQNGELPPLPARGNTFASKAKNYSLNELWAISKLANHTASDLFHAPHYVIPLGLKKPLVVTVHDLIHLKFPEYFPLAKRAYARWMLKRVGQEAQAVLTVSKCTKQDLIRGGLVPEQKIVVCYHGISVSLFQPPEPKPLQTFKALYHLPDQYLLFVGNLKPHKNVSGLIAAWDKLPNSCRPALVIVGERIDSYPILYNSVRRLQRQKEVLFLGGLNSDELLFAYHGAAGYVQPSWYEGFGFPPLEAMAAGIPAAVSNRGALPEIVGESALIFDPAQPEEFTASLARLLQDSALRQILSEKGKLRAQQFTWRRAAQTTLNVYQKVVGESPS